METNPDFSHRLAAVIADAAAALGVRALWKDADPAARVALPPHLATHRNAFCMQVKSAAGRLARCIAADDYADGDFPAPAPPRLRTCPFGVTEVVVPVHDGGIYHGCLFIGPWHRGAGTPPRGLAPFPGPAKALAAGRLLRAALVPHLGLRAAEASRRHAAAQGDDLIAAAVRAIDARLSSRLRAATIAATVHLSTSRFLHRFRAATGETFHGHVAARLMEEAARRVCRPGSRILDIALDLGFASPAYFATAFRLHHGESPSAFRQRVLDAGA